MSTLNVVSILSSATGKVLLGTGTPTYNFEINNGGQVSNFFNTGYRYTSANQVSNGVSNITTDIQVKTQYGIWASIFYATSDQRIKKNISSIENGQALEVIRQINPVTYQYIDQINRHNQLEYGFIAQDVKTVLPHAVQQSVDFIPNIYDLADITPLTETASILTLRSKETDDVEKDDILQILDRKEQPHIVKVLDKNKHSIIVEGNVIEEVYKKDLTEEEKQNTIQENTVFVYGKQVKDLNILEKHAIYSVGMAAIQEIDRIVLERNRIIEENNQMIQELMERIKNNVTDQPSNHAE
jgi:hypothetical protein